MSNEISPADWDRLQAKVAHLLATVDQWAKAMGSESSGGRVTSSPSLPSGYTMATWKKLTKRQKLEARGWRAMPNGALFKVTPPCTDFSIVVGED